MASWLEKLFNGTGPNAEMGGYTYNNNKQNNSNNKPKATGPNVEIGNTVYIKPSAKKEETKVTAPVNNSGYSYNSQIGNNEYTTVDSRRKQAESMKAFNNAAATSNNYLNNLMGLMQNNNAKVNTNAVNLPAYTPAKEFSYADYESPYADAINDLLYKLNNKEDFKYDYMSDPLYQAYAKQYGISGALARQDTLGDVASMTGGMPSSAAVAAAQQAQNDWNSRLSAVIPELENAAYQKYQGKYNDYQNALNNLQNLENTAYSRYADQRDSAYQQYINDRDYDYSQYLNNRDFEYQKQIDDRNYNLSLQNLNNKNSNSNVSSSASAGGAYSTALSLKSAGNSNSDIISYMQENGMFEGWSNSDVNALLDYLESISSSSAFDLENW